MPKKLRGCLIALAILIVGVIVVYNGARWSYYQGWWGKDNPIARYLWLCDAPPGFEQTLYPENVEILVPACEGVGSVEFTSDKQYLRVRTTDWVEIATGHITTTRPSYVQYITRYRLDEDKNRITIWIHLDTHEVITTHPDSVTLEECGRDYDFREGLFSEDSRRLARRDGIYDAASGAKLLDYGLGYVQGQEQTLSSFYPCAWLPDNQGLILIPPSLPWGLELLIFSYYGEYLPQSNYPVPQPVLQFNVPEAYR